MNIRENIEEAVNKDPANPILIFNDYKILKVLGGGEQAVVLKVKNKIGKEFALKIYDAENIEIQLTKSEDGITIPREIKILTSLYHKNIVTIYTGGLSSWNVNEEKWILIDNLTDDLPKSTSIKKYYYYYIMDYIKGEDISSIFPELRDKKYVNPKNIDEVYIKLKFFEELIKQISEAIVYYHSKTVTHKDIKPENIRYSIDDSAFIIVDFGFARHFDSPQDVEHFKKTDPDFLDIASLSAQNYILNDMGQFSLVLKKIIPYLEPIYDINRFAGIKSVIERATNHDLNKRYPDLNQFYNTIKQYFMMLPEWRFSIKINEFLAPNQFGRFNSKLRIPVSGSIHLNNELKSIIDTSAFQRLRGIRQLGPAMFVFPGANHTRFEHSLGSYYLSLKYINRLIDLPKFKEICVPLDESIKLIILSALLHDIGHYPYSHWIEEIDKFPGNIKFPSHEDRAKDIICNSDLRIIIEDKWKVDPIKLSNIISNKVTHGRDVFINSFINSIIDVDKLDYLVRDSIHCGVNYGMGIDIDRILDSLYINEDVNKLCLTDKGKSCLLSILTCRNIMYQEVYWHKTNKACDAMFKRFFCEYVKNSHDITNIKQYLNYCDDHFIYHLYNRTLGNEISKLISPFAFKGRLLYKPAYIYHSSNMEKESPDSQRFFKKIFSINSYADMMDLSNNLANELSKRIPGIKPLDILIEKTWIKPHRERYELLGLEIWNIRKNRYEKYPKEVNDLNEYLFHNEQAYIFCNPMYYSDLKELVKTGALNKILGDTIP